MNPKPKSFGMVLVGDFTESLRIPWEFMKDFEVSLPHIFYLMPDLGESQLVIMQEKNRGCFFTLGWSDFVKHQNLQIGDLLIFYFVGNTTFEVAIYDRTTCCKKKTSLEAKRHGDTGDGVQLAAKANPKEEPSKKHRVAKRTIRDGVKRARNGQKCSAQILLKKYHSSSIVLPTEFAKEAGLRKKKDTVLRDSAGEEWPVSISFSKGAGQGQARFTTGWKAFWAANRLVAGTTILLQFSGGTGDAIDVQILGPRGGDLSGGTGQSLQRLVKQEL
ncbi:hypothetical protein SLA2020_469860 [Shorea laevis]